MNGQNEPKPLTEDEVWTLESIFTTFGNWSRWDKACLLATIYAQWDEIEKLKKQLGS